MSLSFSLSPDGSQAVAGPVIATPPSPSLPLLPGHQEYLSASAAGFHLMDDDWKIWRCAAAPKIRPFRLSVTFTKNLLVKTLAENPNYFNPEVEGVFAVESQRALKNGSAPRKWGKVSYMQAHESFLEGGTQHLNECFLDRPICPVWDIELHDAELAGDDLKQAQFINNFIGHISRRCAFSSEGSDYMIMQCFHPDKFSLHIVYRGKLHYANSKAQWLHMLECGVETTRFGIDQNIYSNGMLRALGSTKWLPADKPECAPIVLRGQIHSQVDFRTFRDCFAQYISPGSRVIEVTVPEQRRRMEPNNADIEEILAMLSKIYEQELSIDDVSAKGYTDHVLHFEIDRLSSCQCGTKGVKIFADVRPFRKVCRLQRTSFCCKEIEFGYTEKSMRYHDQLQMLDFFEKHGLDRISTPIYDDPNPQLRSFGFFETSAHEVCEKLGVEMPDYWTYFYIDPRRGSLVDPEFWKFIRDAEPGHYRPDDIQFEKTTKRLCSYMQLFACSLQKIDRWCVRTMEGIVKLKKATVKDELFGGCCYEHRVMKGRGDDKEVVVTEKSFWQIFERKGNYSFAGVTLGPLDLLNRSRVSLTPPKQVDVRLAMKKFLDASPGTRECLKNLWKTYLKMAVAYEYPEMQPRLADFLLEWVCAVMFDSFTPTQILVLFLSAGGGQGKSSLGNFICSFLGTELSTSGSSANNFFNSGFTGGTNNFIFLDEFRAKKETADMLKEAVTAQTVMMRYLYENPFQEKNRRNFFCCTNNEFVMGMNARRFCVAKFLDVQQLEVLENCEFFKYDCVSCPRRKNAFGEWEPCEEHSYFDHASFIDRFHSLITNRKDGEEDFVRGPYFEHFVGMFYGLFLEKKNTRVGTIMSRLPLTRAAEECLLKVESQAGKFIEFCNERKFHWSPAESPAKLNTVWTIERSWLAIAFEQKRGAAPVWEQYVPKGTLYSRYVEWAISTNSTRVPENQFFDQLEAVCRQRLGHSLTDNAQMKKCEKMIYSREGGEIRPSMKNLDDVAFEAVILDMGTGPWIKPPPRERIVRSASNNRMEPNQNSNSNGSFSDAAAPLNPGNFELLRASNTRQLAQTAAERREEQENIRARKELEIVRRAHAEADNAMDGFEDEMHLNASKRIRDEEIEGYEEQDRDALEEDVRAEIRLERLGRSKYLRVEASESDGEDSSLHGESCSLSSRASNEL
jgi:hypothetical protein